MSLNDLERQFTAVISVMRVATKRLRLESRGFPYKVALYLSYQHIKFDDEMKCPQLNWRPGLALFAARFLSYWDL